MESVSQTCERSGGLGAACTRQDTAAVSHLGVGNGVVDGDGVVLGLGEVLGEVDGDGGLPACHAEHHSRSCFACSTCKILLHQQHLRWQTVNPL